MSEDKKDKLFEDAIKQGIRPLEEKIAELKTMIRNDVLPQTENKLKENVFISVGVSLIIGFFVGVIFSLTGKGCGKKN